MFATKSKKPEATHPIAAPVAVKPPAAPQPEAETPFSKLRNDLQNVIGKGTIIEGNIVAEGDLIIEGTVRGDVTTKTTLIIGPSCIVEGNLLAEHAEVAGQVKGKVQALGLLVIKSSSMIDGDVLTKNLNVESGSTFNGRFIVGSVTSTNAPMAKKTETNLKPDNGVLGGDIRRSVHDAAPVQAKV